MIEYTPFNLYSISYHKSYHGTYDMVFNGGDLR